uniref:protein-tyrosine-phosphatase n=1 Tax=Cryptomonas curvata TaxID=233186 RepID=A0A7S0LU52_9CRYP
MKEPDAFSKIQLSPPVGLVVNAGAAGDQCPTKTGFYGPDVLVLRIDLLDEPNAGDAKQYFRPINANIRSVIRSGKSVVVHCAGSISRGSALVIAYLMETKYLSAVNAAALLKKVWDSTWPCDAFVHQLLAFEYELIAAERLITGPKRPPGNHGCELVEIIPGIVNVHFNEIDKPDSIAKINASGKVSRPITLVVNSAVANKQCDTYAGFYGPEVEVLEIDLFDDPKDGEAHKWPGDSAPFFRSTNARIKAHLAAGNAVVIHCMASLSRSICFVVAHLLEAERMTLLQALAKVKTVWDATWPNDHFLRELQAFEEELGLGPRAQ